MRDETIRRADVLVAGAGLVGLAAGIGLARSGLEVVVAGPCDSRDLARTVALLGGGLDVLAGLGVGAAVTAASTALRVMRLVDDTGSLFAPPPVSFEAREIGLSAFGRNIESLVLSAILEDAAARTPGLTRLSATAEAYDLAQGASAVVGGVPIEVALVVAADGSQSPARQAAGIGTRAWAYPQEALTALLTHERPHAGVSTEFHTREGPMTFVPLPDGPEGLPRSSLVWVMTPRAAVRRAALDVDAFGAEVTRASHRSFGAVKAAGARGRFPMRGLTSTRLAHRRVVLVGEAAHVMPPIGAQGLNLGLRDVADLVALVRAAKARGQDIGADGLLHRYESAREVDVALRTAGVDALNRSLLADVAPVDLARGLGLRALGSIGPLRRFAMRRGLGPGHIRPAAGLGA